MTTRYRKRPVEVEANEALARYAKLFGVPESEVQEILRMRSPSPDIFAATYEPVEEESP